MFKVLWISGIIIVVWIILSLYIVIHLRKVVPTNEVHIVQKGRKSVYSSNDFDMIIKSAEELSIELLLTDSKESSKKKEWFELENKLLITEEIKNQIIENNWGVLFKNCTIWVDCDEKTKFSKTISVEKKLDNWELSVFVFNLRQFNNQMKRYNK